MKFIKWTLVSSELLRFTLFKNFLPKATKKVSKSICNIVLFTYLKNLIVFPSRTCPHWLIFPFALVTQMSLNEIYLRICFLFVPSSSTTIHPEAFIADRHDLCWNSTSALIAKVLLVLEHKCINKADNENILLCHQVPCCASMCENQWFCSPEWFQVWRKCL